MEAASLKSMCTCTVFIHPVSQWTFSLAILVRIWSLVVLLAVIKSFLIEFIFFKLRLESEKETNKIND